MRAGLTKPRRKKFRTRRVLRHEAENLRYVHSGTTSPASARRDVFQQYLRVFFGGSREALMTTLLAQESWMTKELDALQPHVERVHKERSRS